MKRFLLSFNPLVLLLLLITSCGNNNNENVNELETIFIPYIDIPEVSDSELASFFKDYDYDSVVTFIIDSTGVDENGEKFVNVYYYFGRPCEGETDPKDLNNVNNIMLSSLYFSYEDVDNSKNSNPSVREILQRRNADMISFTRRLHEKLLEGEFGDIESKEERQNALELYKKAYFELREDQNIRRPLILVKSTNNASETSLERIKSELSANSIMYFKTQSLTPLENKMINNYKEIHKGYIQ